MRVLIACEESQRVCMAFREKGHEAYSCDILDCSFKAHFDNKKLSWNDSETARLRSQTPIGVAKAMAKQWG